MPGERTSTLRFCWPCRTSKSPIALWQEGAELWRGLRARFPDGFAGHSREQNFSFGDDFLLRRHDDRLEIAGDVAAVQYVSEIVEAERFRFPAKRRAYVRGSQSHAIRDLLLISLHLSDFRLMNEGRSELECSPDILRI
jgi:hypothetical protein